MQVPEVIYGIGIPALIMGLLRILSGLGIPRKLIPLCSIIIGPVLALLLQTDLGVDLGKTLLIGLYWGLSPVGAHSSIKNVSEHFNGEKS